MIDILIITTYTIIFTLMLFGIKIVFMRDSKDSTIIIGCLFIAIGIMLLLKIFNFI